MPRVLNGIFSLSSSSSSAGLFELAAAFDRTAHQLRCGHDAGRTADLQQTFPVDVHRHARIAKVVQHPRQVSAFPTLIVAPADCASRTIRH